MVNKRATPRNPKHSRVSPEDETRIAIHTVARDLIRILAKRRKLPMNRVVWEALQCYWVWNDYDPAEMYLVLNPPPCQTCGVRKHLSHEDREELIRELTRPGWEERAKHSNTDRERWNELADQMGLTHKDCKL